MSDLRITEFRERAERGVEMPDLGLIEERGRALRRRRAAGAVGTLALAVVAGAGVAAGVRDKKDASPPPADPAPALDDSWDDQVRKMSDGTGEELLRPGRSVARYDGVEVAFEVRSDQWEWGHTGAGLRIDGNRDRYATTVFWLSRPSARLGTCDGSRVEPLGTDPADLVGNVAPLRDLVASTVVRQPRVVDAFGTRAVHLQLRAGTGCTAEGPLPDQLRGMVNGETFDPGWEGPHLVDAWHVVVGEGDSVLVVAWRLGGSRADAGERRALGGSIRITPAG